MPTVRIPFDNIFAYFIFKSPSNLLLHKIGARIWIARSNSLLIQAQTSILWPDVGAEDSYSSGQTECAESFFKIGNATA